MKYLLVVLLSPIYVIINLFKEIIEGFLEITDPIAEGMISIVNNMYDFWSKIFKWNDKK